jgi:hypothetical protein
MRHPKDRQRQQGSNNRPLRCSHNWWANEGIQMVQVKVDLVDPIGVTGYIQRVEITIPQLRVGA